MPECRECKKTENELALTKCVICFKYYCEEHAHHVSGRTFCSSHCADYYFFADPDDY